MTQQTDEFAMPSAGQPTAGAATSTNDAVVVAKYDNYGSAQAAVDLLSDQGFDVAKVDIVGRGLQTVESVQGRMTNAKAAGLGALSGVWFGLWLGLLFMILIPGIVWTPLLWAIGLGAVWGALFGFIGHAMTRGERDFTSLKTLKATTYELQVSGGLADQAKQVLAAGRA